MSFSLKNKLQGYGEEVKDVIEQPMDDTDIRDKVGKNTKILKYTELSNYHSLEQLLPRKIDWVYILYLDSPNTGHWVGLIRDYDNIYYLDSYGGKVDEPLSWIDCNTRNKLGVNIPLLTRLFNNNKDFNLYYNPIKYQKENDDVNSCGRYITLFILQLKRHIRIPEGSYISKRNYSTYNLEDFYRYMEKIKNKYKIDYDEIVSTLIDE